MAKEKKMSPVQMKAHEKKETPSMKKAEAKAMKSPFAKKIMGKK